MIALLPRCAWKLIALATFTEGSHYALVPISWVQRFYNTNHASKTGEANITVDPIALSNYVFRISPFSISDFSVSR